LESLRKLLGWDGERKRGKLEDLNALLLDGERARFRCDHGRPRASPNYRFVITLDTDTQLPAARDAARQIVGTLAHPLDRRVFPPGTHNRWLCVLAQHINQSAKCRKIVVCTAVFRVNPASIPYSRAVSDVYQDLRRKDRLSAKASTIPRHSVARYTVVFPIITSPLA
jgi:hypothetical protein